jgi:hypothetical protein
LNLHPLVLQGYPVALVIQYHLLIQYHLAALELHPFQKDPVIHLDHPFQKDPGYLDHLGHLYHHVIQYFQQLLGYLYYRLNLRPLVFQGYPVALVIQ